ncbi:MAG: RNA polymerase sigma factor [Gaiellaceae bacterium]
MRGDAGLAPATSARAHAGLPGSAHRISPGLGSPPCFVAERRRSEGSAIPRGGRVAGLPGLPGAGSCTRERFERLFADHREALLAYALRRATQEAAEDVVVDAFMVVWRRLDDVPHDARPWLFGVARRVLADQRRNAWRRASLPARVATQPPATRSRRSRVPERDSELLLLVAWDGLTPGEAARALRVSRVAPRVRLHRARKRLARNSTRRTRPSSLLWNLRVEEAR